MEATSLQTLISIVIGAILGIVGQGIRIVVGLKKANDEAKQNQIAPSDIIDAKRIGVSLLISLIVGAIAGVLAVLQNMNTPLTQSVLITIISAGYAGTDFIEGFMRNGSKLPLASQAAIAKQQNLNDHSGKEHQNISPVQD